jgi:hypothetical protein
MHPLVRGATAAAIFTALGSLDRSAAPPVAGQAPRAEVRGVDGLPALCGAGTLPEGPVCIRIPSASDARAPELAARGAPVRTSIGEESIPRRPERPADLAAYAWPIGGSRAPRLLEGGGDRASLRLAARPGEKVTLLALDRQKGPAEVLFADDLDGTTVITAHTVEEGGHSRVYLLVHGGLDHVEPGIAAGAKLEAGAVLGAAPLTAGGALIAITFEARELRDGAKLEADPKRLTDTSVSVPTDARNVLPLK